MPSMNGIQKAREPVQLSDPPTAPPKVAEVGARSFWIQKGVR